MKIWDANPKIVDKMGEHGELLHVEKLHAQLHALLAAQDADHLSRDDAVVRRHGRRAERRARPRIAASWRCRHRGDAVLSRRGARRGCTA